MESRDNPDGEELSEEEKWTKLQCKLKALARSLFRRPNPSSGDISDIVVSTIGRFYELHVAGPAPYPNDDEELWRLLTTYLFQKGRDHSRFEPKYRDAVRLPYDDGDAVAQLWRDFESRRAPQVIAEKFLHLVVQMPDSFEDPLTRQVASQLLQGRSIRAIAGELGVRPSVVRKHRTLILDDLERRVVALDEDGAW
jgi:hypothetical protein